MKTRVAIWAAVSSKPQAADDKTSLQDQEDLGRQYAAKIGGEVVRIYKVPGHTRDIVFWHEAEAEMEAYRELRQDIEAGNFDTLWVLDPDRLGRDPALSNQVVSLVEKSGASLHLSSGDYSIGEDSSAHRYLFAIQAVRAGEDQRKRKQYHEFGMRGRVKRGLHPGNWPHGYRPIRNDKGDNVGAEFVSGEIEAVELATRLYLEGVGMNRITQALERSPYRPRKGTRWWEGTVWRMLHNDTYAGVVQYGDKVRASEPSDCFPAVWNADTLTAIIRERARREQNQGGSAPASPVSGIVVCALCGWKMGTYSHSGRRYFRCAKHIKLKHVDPCHYNSIPEHTIIEALETELANMNWPQTLSDNRPTCAALQLEIENTQARITEIEAKQDRITDKAGAGILSDASAGRVNRKLEEDLTAAKQALGDAKKRLALLPDQSAIRAALRGLIGADLCNESIEVMRAKLQRAGVRVYVKEHKITDIEFGVVD